MVAQNSSKTPEDAPGEPKDTWVCTCEGSDGMTYCDACLDYFAKPLKNKDLEGLDKQI